MGLQELPPEILYAISQDVVALGPSRLVGLTRVSRRLHAISNEVLYSTDVHESGGLRSMYYGLKTGLNNVVKLCLSAGADPDLRFRSRKDLDSYFLPVSQAPSHRPRNSNDIGMHFPESDFHIENGRNAHGPSLSENPGSRAVDLSFHHEQPFLSNKAFYWTPLHVAATRGDAGLLSLLLDHGANPKSAGRGVCPCYYNPLRRTFSRRLPLYGQYKPEMLERTLVTRWSALHVAVCKGNLDSAEQLIGHMGLAHVPVSDESVLAEAQQFFREEPTLQTTAELYPDMISRLTPRLDPLPPLHVAADKYESLEDLARLYAILDQAGSLDGPHPAIDIMDAFGDTPFAVAVFSGRIQIFGSWLRDHGADINYALLDPRGERRSILNALCKCGLYKNALLLMDLNVDINKDTELHSGGRHEPALHLCCGCYFYTDDPIMEEPLVKRREAIVLIKRLIQSGADVNTKARRGTTALMSAAQSNFTAAVRELLEAKPDVGAEDDDGDSALHHAVTYSLSLFPGPGLSAAIAVIQLLLDAGADPNQHSARSGPPLFRRQYRRDGSLVFIREEFDQFSAGLSGSQNAMVFIAPLLITRGADPNIYLEDRRDIGEGTLEEQLETLRGRSLAVSAFFLGEFDSLQSLVACGTNVSRQDYLLMMRSLIDANFRSMGNTSKAVEALFRLLNCQSSSSERSEDRKFIMDAWMEVLFRAVGSRPKLVKALIPHIYLTDMRGPGGKTVLHLVAQWEKKALEKPDRFHLRIHEVLIGLLRCGAGRQIDQPDNKGRSPLHIAIGRGNLYLAKQLVVYGASLHIEHRSLDGSTTISPLRFAIRNYSKASQFKVAVGILGAFNRLHRSADRSFGNFGLLKDLILHFGGNTFDKPGIILFRTTKLLQKLFEIERDVNESDELGNTALHHLIQLLCPSDQSTNDSENLEDIFSSQLPICAANGFVGIKSVAGTTQNLLSESPEEQNTCINMDGHNLRYDSDSDYGDPEKDNRFDLEGYSNDDRDSSDVSDDEECQEAFPRKVLGGSVLDRCSAWIQVFCSLLLEGASLTTRNNSGKTALDYIDELRACEPHTCPEVYRPIIPSLRDFVKRPPFEPEVLAQLDDADLEAIGQPLLCVHDFISFSMDEDELEKAREYEMDGGGEYEWVPYW